MPPPMGVSKTRREARRDDVLRDGSDEEAAQRRFAGRLIGRAPRCARTKEGEMRLCSASFSPLEDDIGSLNARERRRRPRAVARATRVRLTLTATLLAITFVARLRSRVATRCGQSLPETGCAIPIRLSPKRSCSDLESAPTSDTSPRCNLFVTRHYHTINPPAQRPRVAEGSSGCEGMSTG